MLIRCYIFFFFKQKTAYEMRISDWSSDVCSSDLASLGSGWIKLHPESIENIPTMQEAKPGLSPEAMNNQMNVGKEWEDNPNWSGKIGRASCRERVCQYV